MDHAPRRSPHLLVPVPERPHVAERADMSTIVVSIAAVIIGLAILVLLVV